MMRVDFNKIKGRRIETEGAYNIRELGEYAGTGGRKLRKHRFVRADSLSRLTDGGIQTLLDWGVDCVVDLRSGMEMRRMPDVFENSDMVDYHHIPMLDYIQSNMDESAAMFPESMEAMYQGLLDKSAEQFHKVFQVFADNIYDCVLFHCTAGKDRTGVAAMLLLGLAGVDHETIVEDYSWSQYFVSPLEKQKMENSWIPEYVYKSEPATMRATLAYLEHRYGGARGYLTSIGIDGAMQECILHKLFEEEGAARNRFSEA